MNIYANRKYRLRLSEPLGKLEAVRSPVHVASALIHADSACAGAWLAA